MNLCDINEIKALLARHGFHFSKSLGQNFLIENWVPQNIAAASGVGKGMGVLEIGPGIGPLTAELARRAEKVAAVELDKALLPILVETLAGFDNVTVIPGDVMKLDLPALVAQQFPGLTPMVCANLPYNITTPVITLLLESGLFSTIPLEDIPDYIAISSFEHFVAQDILNQALTYARQAADTVLSRMPPRIPDDFVQNHIKERPSSLNPDKV